MLMSASTLCNRLHGNDGPSSLLIPTSATPDLIFLFLKLFVPLSRDELQFTKGFILLLFATKNRIFFSEWPDIDTFGT